MATIVIEHAVADFAAWKKIFDADPLGREHSGVIRHTIFRVADEPDTVVIQLDFATAEQARAFLPRLHELWKRAGAQAGIGSAAQARMLDEVERLDY